MYKRIIWTVLLCFVITALVPVRTFAINRIDLSSNVNLTVTFAHEGQPMQGVDIRIYKVGSISDTGEMILSEQFAAYPLPFSDLEGTDWSSLAETMAAYAAEDGLQPMDRAVTDEAGRVYFPRKRMAMEPGYYLVTGDSVTCENVCYTPAASLVALPGRQEDSHQWDYDVAVVLKYTMRSVPPPDSYDENLYDEDSSGGEDDSVTESGWEDSWKEDSEKLPQTGSLWWPVPLMLIAGLSCLIAAVVRMRRT